ncbi:hypothetical protein SBA6_470044 [Candidatus Sulfopaludibacter sp. SbA6]|nr:hypothetical protein SBA6_470044 [Candidatus Sulfopaludibacter sp. SbA6]
MPILDDILDHDLLGTEFRNGELKGEQNLLRPQVAYLTGEPA